jgi:hypothetical protein
MIEGSKIVKVRSMTDAEFKREYWDNCPSHPVYVLELDNGCQIFPSCDYEGNGGGALFGHDSNANKGFTIAVDRKLPKQPVDTSHLSNEDFGKFIKQNCE